MVLLRWSTRWTANVYSNECVWRWTGGIDFKFTIKDHSDVIVIRTNSRIIYWWSIDLNWLHQNVQRLINEPVINQLNVQFNQFANVPHDSRRSHPTSNSPLGLLHPALRCLPACFVILHLFQTHHFNYGIFFFSLSHTNSLTLRLAAAFTLANETESNQNVITTKTDPSHACTWCIDVCVCVSVCCGTLNSTFISDVLGPLLFIQSKRFTRVFIQLIICVLSVCVLYPTSCRFVIVLFFHFRFIAMKFQLHFFTTHSSVIYHRPTTKITNKKCIIVNEKMKINNNNTTAAAATIDRR